MAEQEVRTPVFLGLAKPRKIMGLPMGYFMILALGTLLPWMYTKLYIIFLLPAIGYPVLFFVADKEPFFFELVRVAFGRFYRTPNRSFWGGDSYGS